MSDYNNVYYDNRERLIDQLKEEFVRDAMRECKYASEEAIRESVVDVVRILKEGENKSIEELLEEIVSPYFTVLESIRSKYPVPGYDIGVSVGYGTEDDTAIPIDVQLYGGNIDGKGMHYDEESKLYVYNDKELLLPNNALFDLASITKLYTFIIAYNLLAVSSYNFSLDSKVKDLDDRFVNLGDVTIRQLLGFNVCIRTETIAEKATDKDSAEKLLFAATTFDNFEGLPEGGKIYEYSDMPMMVLKYAMERVTGKTYGELVDRYIIKKLKLNDTHLIVPESKINLITGTPNRKLRRCNDPKANLVSVEKTKEFGNGAAGMFATGADLRKLMLNAHDLIPNGWFDNAYKPGSNMYQRVEKKEESYEPVPNTELYKKVFVKNVRYNQVFHRGHLFGSSYTAYPTGTKVSFTSVNDPQKITKFQGSTRTEAGITESSYGNSWFKTATTTLTNPCCMNLEIANKISQELGKGVLVKSYFANGKELYLVDARNMMPAKVMEGISDNILSSLRNSLILFGYYAKLSNRISHDKGYSFSLGSNQRKRV